jgi:hypothetical protein
VEKMGYYDGVVDDDFNINVDFSNIQDSFREHFPYVAYPQEVLFSLLNQMEKKSEITSRQRGRNHTYH